MLSMAISPDGRRAAIATIYLPDRDPIRTFMERHLHLPAANGTTVRLWVIEMDGSGSHCYGGVSVSGDWRPSPNPYSSFDYMKFNDDDLYFESLSWLPGGKSIHFTYAGQDRILRVDP
jgi:hypothetical protein